MHVSYVWGFSPLETGCRIISHSETDLSCLHEMRLMGLLAVIRIVQGEVPWVSLYGPPGSGKAHLAAAAATAPELLVMIRDGFDAGQAEGLIGLCQRVPWLVVDDLGAERLTDWAAEVLFRVFNARYTARAHTLMVSNVRPEEVPEAGLRSRFLRRRGVPGGAEWRRGLPAVWR